MFFSLSPFSSLDHQSQLALDLNLPKKIVGTTISIACLSGLEAVHLGVNLIEQGDSEVVIAGGSDSTSNGELPMPRKFTQAFAKYQMGGGNKKGFQGVKELLKVHIQYMFK